MGLYQDISKLKLRKYQSKVTRQIVAQWKAGHRSVLLVMPPNAGKTVVYEHIVVAALKRGERVCVVAPNIVLVQQTIDKMAHLNPGVIWAGRPANLDARLQVASAMTLANREGLYQFDLIIIDEAHHAAADTWMKILGQHPEAKVLGVTATAKRLDGKGLDTCGFTAIVHGPWIDLLTPEFMAPYRLWAPNVPALLDAPEGRDYKPKDLEKHGIKMGVLIGDAVKHYKTHCSGKRALAFCMSIKDSIDTVKKFKRAGFKAAHMDGDTPNDERAAMLADLNAHRLDVISSCNVLSEGLDIPGVDVVIQLRSTRSYQVYIQQIGRGLRQDFDNPDKMLEVIDCAGNYFRLWNPSLDRKYGLDGKSLVTPEQEAREASRVRCDKCSLVYYADGKGYCPGCFEKTPAKLRGERERRRAVWRDGELVRVGLYDLVFPNRNIEGRFILCAGGIYVALGNDRNKTLAYERFNNFISARTSNGRNPHSLEEAHLWCGRPSLRSVEFPKPNASGVFCFRDYGIQVSLGTVNIENMARRRFENYLAARTLVNRPPLSKEEADRWKYVDTGLRPISMPIPNTKGNLVLWDSKMHIFLGDVSNYQIAKQRFESYAKERDFHGRLPITKDEANAWKLKNSDMIPLRFPSPNHAGTLAVQIGRNRIYIGNKNDIDGAKSMLDLLNAKRNLLKREPVNEAEAREWMGLQIKSPLLTLKSSTQAGRRYFYFSKGYDGKHTNYSFGCDKKKAEYAISTANDYFLAYGYWPPTKDEFESLIDYKRTRGNAPMIIRQSIRIRDGITVYRVSKRADNRHRSFSLGTNYAIAKEMVDRANIRFDREGCWPDTEDEIREWLGLPPNVKYRPLRLRAYIAESGANVYRINGHRRCIRLGTDRAAAQARVDAANARWEANGHKWPDTEDEFREWLGLPPKKKKT